MSEPTGTAAVRAAGFLDIWDHYLGDVPNRDGQIKQFKADVREILNGLGDELTGQWSVRYRDSDGDEHEWVRQSEYAARRILRDIRRIDPDARLVHRRMWAPRVVEGRGDA